MSKVIKIMLMFIIILTLFATTCFAIDEAELYPNSTKTNNISAKNESIEASNSAAVNNSTNSITTTSIQDTSAEEDIDSELISPSIQESDSYTTIGSVDTISDGSTFASIISIALIVVGILLILLAIAILIRLKS